MNLKNYLLFGCCLSLGASAIAHDRSSALPQRPGMNPRFYEVANASFQEINRSIRNAGAPTAAKTSADPDRVLAQSRYSYSGSTATLQDSANFVYSGSRGSKFSDYLLSYGVNNPADAPGPIEGTDTYVNYDTMKQMVYGTTPSTSVTSRTYNTSDKVEDVSIIRGNRKLLGYNAAGKLSNVTILRYQSGTGVYDSVQRETIAYASNGNLQQRTVMVYDSSTTQWIPVIDYGFVANSAGQILSCEIQYNFGSGVEPYLRYNYNYGAAGKFVRSVIQQHDGTNYVDAAKDSIGYSTGGVMVFENYSQANATGGWDIVYSERRHLNAQNVVDSVAIDNDGDASYSKLSYNANNLPTRVTYYDLGAAFPTAEYRYYYPAMTPPVPAAVATAQSVKALSLAPNPAVGQIRLDNKLGGTFRIADLSGRLMMEGGVAPAATIGVEHLTPGIYSILMTDAAGESYSGRFVKQ